MFTLVLLLVVLASMRGSFRAVWLPPGLDAYRYAYQETGDLHTLAATLLNVGEIMSAEKVGKAKNKRENLQGGKTQGAVVRRDWYKVYWPGTSQIPA
jgi:hypothetical protein